jgi:hypothetical protein
VVVLEQIALEVGKPPSVGFAAMVWGGRAIITTPWTRRYDANQDKHMPSLFRFILIVGTLVGLVLAGLYVLATRFEPEQQTISKPVQGVKVRKETKTLPASE